MPMTVPLGGRVRRNARYRKTSHGTDAQARAVTHVIAEQREATNSSLDSIDHGDGQVIRGGGGTHRVLS